MVCELLLAVRDKWTRLEESGAELAPFKADSEAESAALLATKEEEARGETGGTKETVATLRPSPKQWAKFGHRSVERRRRLSLAGPSQSQSLGAGTMLFRALSNSNRRLESHYGASTSNCFLLFLLLLVFI